MSFIKEFTRAIILARVKEKRVGEARKAIGFPERIPMLRRIPLQSSKILPPPKLPSLSAQPLAAQERPLQKFLPVPTPAGLKAPSPENIITQVLIRQPEQPKDYMQEEQNQDLSGYTKINIPSPEGIDVPVPEEKITRMDELPSAQPALPPPPPSPRTPMIQRAQSATRGVQAPPQQTQAPSTAQRQKGVTPLKDSGIDFGSISDFVADPYIKAIEFSDGKIKVRTDRGEKEQGSLSEEEAKQIVERFAKAANVEMGPALEASVSGLKLEAVISEVLGIRFVLEKI